MRTCQVSARLHTTAETAEILGVGEQMVTAERTSGRLTHRKIGRFIRFADEDIDAYVELIKARNIPGTLRRSDAARRRKRAA